MKWMRRAAIPTRLRRIAETGYVSVLGLPCVYNATVVARGAVGSLTAAVDRSPRCAGQRGGHRKAKAVSNKGHTLRRFLVVV